MEGGRPADASRPVAGLNGTHPRAHSRQPVCAPDLEREAAELDRAGVHQGDLRIGEDLGEHRAGRSGIANLVRLDQPAAENPARRASSCAAPGASQ